MSPSCLLTSVLFYIKSGNLDFVTFLCNAKHCEAVVELLHILQADCIDFVGTAVAKGVHSIHSFTLTCDVNYILQWTQEVEAFTENIKLGGSNVTREDAKENKLPSLDGQLLLDSTGSQTVIRTLQHQAECPNQAEKKTKNPLKHIKRAP